MPLTRTWWRHGIGSIAPLHPVRRTASCIAPASSSFAAYRKEHVSFESSRPRATGRRSFWLVGDEPPAARPQPSDDKKELTTYRSNDNRSRVPDDRAAAAWVTREPARVTNDPSIRSCIRPWRSAGHDELLARVCEALQHGSLRAARLVAAQARDPGTSMMRADRRSVAPAFWPNKANGGKLNDYRALAKWDRREQRIRSAPSPPHSAPQTRVNALMRGMAF